MSDGVLDEAAAFFEFFAVVGFFRGEGAIFEFPGFCQVIIDAYLRRHGQVNQRKNTQ